MTQAEKTENQVTTQHDYVPDIEPILTVEAKGDELPPGEIRDRINTLRESIDNNSIELCRYLWTVSRKEHFRLWGYESFKDYISKEVTFKISKALSYVRIWDHLHQNEEIAKKVMSVGWAKARELIWVVTEENVDQWVEKSKHLNVEEVIKEVRMERNKLIPDNEREVVENADKVEGTNLEDSVKSMTFQFVYQSLLQVSKALDQVKSDNPGMNNGTALGLICADFTATNNFEGRGKEFAVKFLQKYEHPFDLEITVRDRATGAVLYGK